MVTKIAFQFLCVALPASAVLSAGVPAQVTAPQGPAWKHHAIENRLFGSDGIRLADVNRDGLPDVLGSWENAGLTGIYFHPILIRKPRRVSSLTDPVCRAAEPVNRVRKIHP